MWKYIIVTILWCSVEMETRPQWMPVDNALPPLPPTSNVGSNFQWPSNQQTFPALPPTQTSDFIYDPIGSSQGGWPNKPIPPPRQPTYRMDNLNEGMQKEVWDTWMPNNNYGFHMGSRPDLGRGGWMARRTLTQATQTGTP